MAGLKFDITGDNGNMLSALQGVQNGVRQTQSVVEQSGQGIEQVFSKIQSAAAAAAGAFSAKELVRNVLEVRGQFQQLEVAFTTMLGNAEKANTLMDQLVRTAATTPFDLKSVSEGAKQLLAYGTQADEVNGTLIRLGDIAAGLSIPLNDLVYLYGSTMTQGRMFTQDLRQFQGRGIPIADELAKIFGVTKDKVGELVTAGKVGAVEVQQAIENMTNAGSRFGGLMEAQSHTITGQISNIEDAIDSMFNDIGKANEGVINDALGGISYLVEHWKEIGQIVLNVAAAYGIAKAAVVAWSTYQKVHNLLMEKAAVQMALAKAEGIAMSEAEAMASVATMGFKNALNALKVAIASNPVGALAVALTAVFTAMQLLDDETTELATASNKYGESAAKSIQKVKTLSDEVKGLSNSNKTVTTSTKLSKDVLEELNQVLEESGVARIKEGDSIDTVNKKREMAISLIKEEAIERQRLNNIDAGNKEFDDKINSANEQLRKDLANATFNSTGETILNKIFGSADEVREKSSAIFTVISQTVQENADLVANKTGSAYDKGLNEIYGKIREKMEAMGVSKAALDKAWTDGGWLKQDNLVQKYIDSIQGATEAHYDYNKSINAVAEAEKRAADKTLKFSDKVASITRALQGPNDGVHQLYKNIQKLMEKYKKNTIGFEVQFSGKVPAWMDKMGIPQLSSLAKRFTSLGESLKKGQIMNVNGKTFTKEQLLQRGADYASAMKAKKDKEDAAKNNENKGKSNPIAEQKKALQEQLNSLSYQEAAGRKGAELRRKINALSKKEKVYSSSYDTDNAKEAERKAKEAADEAKREREKRNAENERRFELQQKWDEEDLEQANRSSTARSEVEMAKIKNAHDKELLQLNLAHEQTLKQLKKQETDYKKANLSRQKELWNLNNNDKSKNFYDTSEGKAGWPAQKLTKEQERELISLREKEELEYSKKIEKLQEDEIKNNTEAMRLVLEKYGQFGEQKVAIAMETAQKIAEIEKSGDSDNVKKWKIEEVKREEEKRINSTEADAALQQIDWFTVFGNVGGLMRDALAPLLENLKAFVGTDKFKNLGADQQKQIVDAMNNIRDQVGSNADVSWRELALDMTNFQKSVRIANEATNDYDDLQKRLNPAIEKLSKLILKYTEEGNIDAARNAQTELNMYTSQLYESGKKVERANKDVVSSNRKLSMSANAVAQPIDDIHLFLQNTGLSQLQQVWDGLNQIKGAAKGLKAIKEAAEGVDSIGDAAKDGAKGLRNIGSVVSDALGEGLSKAGLIGQIIAAILKILDILKEGIGTLVSSILDSILGAVAGIINNILSGKFVTQIIGSLVKGIGGILNSIIGNLGHILSFGALNRDVGEWFTGSNEKEVAEKTEALTKSNEYLQKSIDELRNSIDKSNGDTAISNYEKAYEYQKQVITNQAEILRTQMGYHSAHKSNSYYWDGDIKEHDYDVINRILANYKKNNPVAKTISDTVHSQDDMYKLTPEQMMEIKTKDVALWRKILDVGKYDKSEYWEKYVELAGKLEELTEKVNENLTKTTFSSLHDNFVSTLMDMDKSASDFSENFSEMMAKAWLNAAVANLMDSDLKKLQDKWAEKMKVADKDGNPAKLSKEDIDELRNDYNKIVDKGLALRPVLSEITGYNRSGNKEQTATANGVTTITFEQARNIEALTTAGNISRDQTKELVTSIVSNIASLSSFSSSTSATIVEIRNLMITNNSYLEDILKNSKNIYNDFSSKIDDINRNIKELK